MEKQTSEDKDLPDGVKLESMLMKLTTDESPNPQNNVQLHVHPDTTGQHVSNTLELDEETTCKEQNELDSTVKSDADGESPTKNSETKEVNKADEGFKGFPDVIPTWERRRLPPCPLYIQTRKEDDKELRMEEPTEAGAALLHNSQKESPPFHLPKSSERDEKELKDEARGCGAVTKLTRQKPLNVTNRTGRSVSDPEGPHLIQKPKESRRLSAPSLSNLDEYEDIAIERSTKDSGNFSSPKGRKDSGKGESFGVWEHEMSKTQTIGRINKLKTITQKMVGMLKEKPNRVCTDSKSSQDSVEEPQSLSSVEMEVEERVSPPPLPPKRGIYVHFKRTFTLRDFKLNLEPINLMEEIFTEEEWLPYLPSKTSPPQKDAMPENVLRPDKDAELHVPQMTAEQNQTENSTDNHSDVKRDIINKTDETVSHPKNKIKDNSHLHVREAEPNAKIFAIPKALLTNAAQQQRPCRISCEPKNSDDVYDCMGIFMIPKCDFLLTGRRSLDVFLDFSTVKSSELLDSSALKSRIYLSKKRHHRPPKKYRKKKAQRINSKFYEIPS